MKKVFASIPLKGRSKDEIQDSLDKIKEAAEGLLDEKVELLHTEPKDVPDFEKGEDDAREAMKFLSKDLEMMAEADYFATIDCNYDYRHCALEEDIFRRYFCDGHYGSIDNIMKFSTNIVCPDIVKKERERAKKIWGDRMIREDEIAYEEERMNQD